MRTPPRILVVDDTPANVHILQARLAANGYDIVTAADGEAALAAVRETQPDLILLDVMMPRMSGFHVCKQIKSDPKTRETILVMVTALNEASDIERAAECGTDDFITKPVDRRAIVGLVRNLLASKACGSCVSATAEVAGYSRLN